MLGRKLVGNVAAAGIGKATAMAFNLLTFAILARQLGANGLGEYRVVLTVLAFAALAADFGLYAINLKRISARPDEQGRIVGNAIACRLICTLMAVVASTAAAFLADVSNTIRIGMLVMCLGWTAYQGSEMLTGVFQEKLRQDRGALVEIATAASTLVGVTILAWIGAGPVGMLAVTSLGFMTGFIVSFALARGLIRFQPRFDFRLWWSLMKDGLPIAASGLMVMVYVRGDVLTLAATRSAAEVGIYDPASKIYEVSTAVVLLFAGLVMPLLTRDAAHNPERFSGRLAGALSATFAALIAGSVIVLFYAEEIVTLIGGPDYIATALPLRLLVAAIAAESLSLILRFSAIARGWQKKMLRVDIVAAIIGAAAFLLLIPRWSYTGAAIGKFMANATILAGAALISMDREVWRRIARPAVELLAAAALMALTVSWTRAESVHWIISGLIGAVVFMLALIPLRGFRAALVTLSAESRKPRYTV